MSGARIQIIKERMGMLGTPLVMPMKFDDLWLPIEPLVVINRKRIIIETTLDDVEGTFKEGFSNGDYEITIQGTLIDENELEPENYPEKQVRLLRGILNETVKYDKAGDILKGIGSIKVVHQILNMFGIYYIVIYDYNFTQVPGEPTKQNYTLNCKSDINRDLLLKAP